MRWSRPCSVLVFAAVTFWTLAVSAQEVTSDSGASSSVKSSVGRTEDSAPASTAGGEKVGGSAGSPAVLAEFNLVYREVGGKQIKADLFRPSGEGSYPLVMMIHGGAWSLGDKWDLRSHARNLAAQGFVCVSINYRLAPAHQIDEQIGDCRMGLKWCVDNAQQWQADPERIALWGYSAGAHLAALIALKEEPGQPDVDAVIVGGAPCEFSFIESDSRALSHVMGGTRADKPELYRRVSPLEYVTKEAPAFFLYHGSADRLVPVSSSRMLYDQLKKAGVDSVYHMVSGKGHLFTFLDESAQKKAGKFLQERLKDAH